MEKSEEISLSTHTNEEQNCSIANSQNSFAAGLRAPICSKKRKIGNGLCELTRKLIGATKWPIFKSLSF